MGCVFIGAAFRDEPATSSEHFFDGSPDAIRQSAAVTAATIGHEMLGRVRRDLIRHPGFVRLPNPAAREEFPADDVALYF